MAAKIYFTLVDAADEDAFLIEIQDGTIIHGDNPEENLACGACKGVFGRNIATHQFTGRYFSDWNKQVVLKCHCGALNVLKSKSAKS